MEATTISTSFTNSSVPMVRARLNYLDGIRGISALFVLFHHAFFQVVLDQHSGALSPAIARCFAFARYGPTAVIVFIVLSGFCLMLPITNAPNGKPRGGWRQYFSRRAVRILPPYWITLLCTLVLIWLIPGLQQPAGRAWDTAVPALLWQPITAHLLLIHDFTAPYFVRIDPPMWSVAVEWHIYFLFPLLLFAWRKAGIVAAVALGMILGYLPHKLSHGILDFARFHYIGLFALGMAACWIATSTEPTAARWRSSMPWGWIAALFAVLSFVTVPRNFGSMSAIGIPDYVPALAAASLLIYCSLSSHLDTEKGSRLVRMFEAPWCVRVGQFSYSLYLIHYPLLAAMYLGLLRVTSSPEVRLAVLWLVGCPVITLISFGFYTVFERRFVPSMTRENSSAH
jgi:peptidoglycan/LPS O-acetylase OafA/YrhL